MDHLQVAIDRARRRRSLPLPMERRLLRMKAGLTQTDVATCLGTTTAAVSRYESGHREPCGEILEKYLVLLYRLTNA